MNPSKSDDQTTGFKANVDELSFDLVNESTQVNAYNLRGFLVESSTQTNISNGKIFYDFTTNILKQSMPS